MALSADHTTDSFRLLVESVEDYAIYMLDVDGHVRTWNAGAQRIKGYTASEIIGRHYSAFFTREDQEAGRPKAELAAARDSGRFEEEGWRVKKDGTRFWANVVVTAVRHASGELAGFAKVTRDLTARKAAEETARELVREQAARTAAEEGEERLRNERERYRALSNRLEVILEGIVDGVTVQDRSGAVIFANSAAAKVCGFASVEEFLRASPTDVVARFEIFDEEGKPFDPRELPGRRVLGGADTASAVLRVRDRSSGRDWWTLIRSSPVLDNAGEPELAVNIWHDVSGDRRREEHERCLASAAATLSATLDYESLLRSLAGVLVPALADWCSIHVLAGDALDNVAVAHANAARLARVREFSQKYPPDRRHPRGLWNVVRTGAAELYEEISDDLLRQGARDDAHLALLREVGMRSVIIVPIRIRDRVSGTITLVAAESGRRFDRIDLSLAEELGRRAGSTIENARLFSEAQAAAKAASEAARAAEEASRLKDDFLGTVSHELRTPLNAIVGWSSLLRTRTADPSVAKGLEVIRRNAEAQGKIIEDILDVSRIITGKLRLDLKATDLVAVINDAVEVVRPSSSARQISIDFVPPDEPCLLVADPERLQQVVWNLLSNAVKFTEAGGSITIAVERDGSQLQLRVKDSGRGIDVAFLPYVFDRFKQADASTTRRVGGLGLGLAIVRHIVELHGGQVAASSAGTGTGATFSVSLPIRALTPIVEEKEMLSSLPARDAPARQPLTALEGLRVLVVDDEPDARDLLQTLLEDAGAQVRTAASASEAFATLQRFRPEVLVSDIGMPDEDGCELMGRIRALDTKLGGGIPSIALTAYARGEDRTKALGVGFTTHIGKPVKPEDLLSAVANLARFAPRWST